VYLGSEFTPESERTAKSGIIKLSAIRDIVDKVIGTELLLLCHKLANIFAKFVGKLIKDGLCYCFLCIA